MADESNIISLEERLRRKEEAGAAGAAETAIGKNTGEASAKSAAAGDAASEATPPLPGKLVWLHCPACGTLQYTEVVMAGGRAHNVCGNQVEEIELEIDVRAEYTIADINLERLEILAEAVEAQKGRYREYQERLRLIAGANVAAYPVTEETVKNLPVAEVDAMGMMISAALHDPARHFDTADGGEKENARGAADGGEKEKARGAADGGKKDGPTAGPDSPPPKPESP